MEILTQGTLPPEKQYEVTCVNCGCQFRFEKSEAELRQSITGGMVLFITCPTPRCKKRNWIWNINTATAPQRTTCESA
jgi:hypothetical protein